MTVRTGNADKTLNLQITNRKGSRRGEQIIEVRDTPYSM